MCTIKINYYSKFKNFLDEVSLHDFGSREHKHKSIDKQVTRLLAVYLAPSNIAEDVFLKDEKDESVFFQSTLFLHLCFQNSNFKFFLTFAKNTSEKKLKDNFRKKNNSRRILQKNVTRMATLENFKVFSQKSPSLFPRKTRLSNVLGPFTIPFAFYSKFVITCWKNIFTLTREQNDDCSVNAIGKHRWKKREKHRIWEKDFASIC